MGKHQGLTSLVVLLAVGTCTALRPDLLNDVLGSAKTKSGDDFTGEVWALLIAGSAGWGNYRHQADVCHAYQILKRGGLDDDHIVVMMADDLAGNFMNPHPGQVFNQPGGPDVYDGVPLDYTGDNVNAENFLEVLSGHKKGPATLGTSGKLIKSGPEDRVFVYFADHGAPGILGMPTGNFLYADQLIKTLKHKAASKGFADLVIYVEACESGSIFEGLLDKSLNIYATTAANAYESSWGTYCPGMDPSPPSEFSTCLGDLYSVAFLENSDANDLTTETLEKQYELVKRRTSNNGTYNQGSHVLQFGSLAIDEEPAADYLGSLNTGKWNLSANSVAARFSDGGQQSVPQREADLLHLWTEHQRAAPGAAKAAALAALNAETSKRAKIDADVRSAMRDLLTHPAVLTTLHEKYSNSNLLLPALASGSNGASDVAAPIVEQFVSSPLPRAAGLALVDDWDCLRAMMGAWQDVCGPLDQYGMQYSRLFANLCNAGIPVATMTQSAASVCQVRPVVMTA
jgi:legumain